LPLPADLSSSFDAIDRFAQPNVFCVPIEFSSLRDPSPTLDGSPPYLSPYPVFQSGSKPVEYQPANPHLLELHSLIKARGIMPMHFMMGSLQPWYNDCPDCTHLPPHAKRPFKDDRFPVPTNVEANAEAMGRWANAYNASLPIHWGIWQEAGHYLRNGEPQIAAPQYANISYRTIKQMRAASPFPDAQTFGLQDLPSPDTKAKSQLSGKSFLGEVLDLLGEQAAADGIGTSSTDGIGTSSTGTAAAVIAPDPLVDYFGFNQYSPRKGDDPYSPSGLIDLNTDLDAARKVIGDDRLSSSPFLYTQVSKQYVY
jgi:hypothetical protein